MGNKGRELCYEFIEKFKKETESISCDKRISNAAESYSVLFLDIISSIGMDYSDYITSYWIGILKLSVPKGHKFSKKEKTIIKRIVSDDLEHLFERYEKDVNDDSLKAIKKYIMSGKSICSNKVFSQLPQIFSVQANGEAVGMLGLVLFFCNIAVEVSYCLQGRFPDENAERSYQAFKEIFDNPDFEGEKPELNCEKKRFHDMIEDKIEEVIHDEKRGQQ